MKRQQLAEAEQRIELLEEAFTDSLDGNASPHDIHANTGLPLERCEEISKLFYEIIER